MCLGKCCYCFRCPTNIFSSSYIHHIIKDDGNNITMPVFCDENCMLSWAAIKKNMSFDEVVHDFNGYMSQEKQ